MAAIDLDGSLEGLRKGLKKAQKLAYLAQLERLGLSRQALYVYLYNDNNIKSYN